MPEVKDSTTRSKGIFAIPFIATLSITLTLLLSGCVSNPPQPPAQATIENESQAISHNSQNGDAFVTADSDSAELAPADPEHSTLDSAEDNSRIAAAEEASLSVTASTEEDLWDRIRSRFSLADSQHKRTLAEKKWYARHQAYIDRTVERARPYLHLITLEAERLNMPAELVLLPIVESAFQPFAYSHGRAAGIWQFIPSTGRIFGLNQDWWHDGRRDIDASTKAALKYLSNLNRSFGGDWLLALAAYNSGQGTVRKAIRRNQRQGKPTDFWSLQLPKETRAYVPKLLAISAIIKDPAHYGITLKSIADEPYLQKVDTGTQIDLALAADLADISLEELYRLNPAFNRWATSPQGPHSLLLPIAKAEAFERRLAEVPKSKRIKWARHKIKNGESLGQIANKYRTTVKMLRQVNNLRGNMIRAGKSLIIPVATKKMSRYTLSAVQRTQAIQNTPKRGHKTRYTVRKGDTLWDIAQKFRVSVKKLARWNAMAPRDLLRQGQKLVIWKTAGHSKRSSGPSSSVTTQRINYVVRNGDSLALISQRFKVKISELRHWNTLPKNKYIQPGQRLTLYVDVTRQSENI